MPPTPVLPPCPHLPPAVARGLFIGSNGESRLLELAELLMEHLGDEPGPELLATFRDMTLAAWETGLLSSKAARIVRSVHDQSPFLGRSAAAFAAVCAGLRPANREIPGLVNDCLKAGDVESARVLTERAAAGEPGNLFWLRFAGYFGLRLGELDWYEQLLAASPLPGDFAAVFRADLAFAREEYAQAAALYAEAFIATGMPGWLAREGECRLRLGDREAAASCWRRALDRRPWQASLRLRLADLERGADIPGAPPSGKGAILLYSWNHGNDLNLALGALYASALGEAGVTVLDNGSTDTTPDVLAAWQDRFGSRMRTVALPVNVGAPAARNWLLSLPAVRRADWAVFLDDDALVPPDWLGHFGTALRLHPDAGIVGCRVVDKAAPMTIQSVDLFFVRAAGPDQGPERQQAQGVVSETHFHADDPDFGQYSYLRFAASVTGCCHLLTRKNMDAVGSFDLRFSPSQMDDLERDIRSSLQGSFPLYQGHLRVRHMKRSGLGAARTPWQAANCAGNAEKLKRTYPEETLLGLTDAIRAL